MHIVYTNGHLPDIQNSTQENALFLHEFLALTVSSIHDHNDHSKSSHLSVPEICNGNINKKK